MPIRALTLDDLEPYMAHCAESGAESGRDGDPYFGPYGRDEPYPTEGMRERTRGRWSKPLDVPGWRRAWGVFDGDRLVGSADLTGGGLPAELHRVRLGMAIVRSHRRRGLGTALLREIIAWCRAQPAIEWIDLGVFHDNHAARALYPKFGFETLGTTTDRFRMDGVSIDDIAMSLRTNPHATAAELEAGLDHVRGSPKDEGWLELIVRRPDLGRREVPESAELDRAVGLVGDSWSTRGSSRTPDRSPHPDMQINVMNARAVELLARGKDRWPMAGDQLYVDLDLSEDNLPPGTRLAIGTAVIEVTAQPHTGCGKFARRFGRDALKFVNSPVGKELHLRGINAKVVQAGRIRVGDAVRKNDGV